MSKKKTGLVLLHIGAVLFWLVALDPLLALSIFCMLSGITLYTGDWK